MNSTNIAQLRMYNQQLTCPKFQTASGLVSWMGAMQAQDFAMCKWAVGVRLPGSNIADIEQAINSGEILRTHVLRPTWHLVSPKDIRWMLKLTASQIKSAAASTDRKLGLTEDVFAQSNKLIIQMLKDGNHLTRQEIMDELKKAGINTDLNRSNHLMMRAEQEGIVCSGIIKNKKPTYALLDERVPMSEELSQDEALYELGKRYFTSHGPASEQDFMWWSGLTLGLTRKTIQLLGNYLISEKVEETNYWFPANQNTVPATPKITHLLPAFDELLISYKTRAISIDPQHMSRAYTNNGIFKCVILNNEKICGTWRAVKEKNGINIQPDYFPKTTKISAKEMQKAIAQYEMFVKK